MNERKQKDDKLFYLLMNKKKMKASKEARDKSLLVFQDGLNDRADLSKMGSKRRKFLQKVVGSSAAVVVAGIAGLLFLSTDKLEGDRDEGRNAEIIEQENIDSQQNEESTEEHSNEENLNLLHKVLNRPSFDLSDINAMKSKRIFNEMLAVYLPDGWTIEEEEGEQKHSIQMIGSQGERMNLVLFTEDYSQEVFDAQLQELSANLTKAEEISIPVELFVSSITMDHEIPFPYPNVFPFDIEGAKLSAFFDEDNNKFRELYISELFGYPMIYTSELPLDDVESWTLPLSFFTYMEIVDSPFTIHGSEGALHPEYKRPVEKSVALKVGAFGVQQIDVELYGNNELGMSSYLPSNTDIQRIDHEYFTEWRFTEPNVSENSFYSFGKLKDGFPLEKGKEIMFEALNIDLSYYQDLDGDEPYHFSYQSGMDGEFIDGHFQLFEISGEWYYLQKHADRNDYNGGVYMERLEMFIDSIEWY
ncbi:hypothetical protein GMD78_00190 [Ornithinibacillus sp. L9]|uniref:Uncharacterized protein n=1 Tax=Ornithinibacillus caprae TaxID=2678566 RepID=A0A6N8FAZ7_9BACI|nr:hypothetical protein [Ornithinibacillus caprae]MUK86822.1 hypothetical protein [Ornithinibacillus caprae]